MRHIPYAALVLALCAATLSSCTKHPDLTSGTSTYTFTNNVPATLTIDVYNSEADYNNNTNREAQYTVAPGDVLNLKLKALSTYWLDWHSATYTYNNWQKNSNSSTNASPLPKINIALEDDHFNINSFYKDTSRSVLLNGDRASSTWQAVASGNPYMNGTHRFTLYKDFSALYTFTMAGSTPLVRHISYAISNMTYSGAPRFDVTLLDEGGTSFGTLSFGNTYYSYVPPGRDTLMLSMSTTGGYSYYPAVRQ